jgi:hypothetical protein
LYVDEFQSFANKSFADILSEARKYKLGLNITHQYIEQMAEEVRAAVFGNVGTMISFRVGSFDAEILEKEFAPVFTMEDIVNLGFVQIYLKLMIDGVASQPFSAKTLPPILKPDVSFREEVMEMSRKVYSRSKAEVEKVIREWHEPESAVPKTVPGSGANHDKPKYDSSRDKFSPKKESSPASFPVKEKPVEKIETSVPKSNSLAKAIEEAVKAKQNTNTVVEKSDLNKKPEIKTEIRIEPKKETLPLSALNSNGNNKNKEATPENKNALKEALEKIKNEKESKGEDQKSQAKNQKLKEVPEETLRKILKGE